MKKTFFLIISILIIGFPALCKAVDPVADFKKYKPYDFKGDFIISKWTADLTGDGKKVVFLDDKNDVNHLHDDDGMPRGYAMTSWIAYIPNENGTDYLTPSNEGVEMNLDKVYVGQITQLGKKGIVTVQEDASKNGDPVSNIYAYTLEGNQLKKTLLAQYNPDKGSNPIYQQYLSPSKRTQVQLQTVTP